MFTDAPTTAHQFHAQDVDFFGRTHAGLLRALMKNSDNEWCRKVCELELARREALDE